MTNSLYEIPVKVEPGKDCDFPEEMDGAFVNCYSGAESVNEAIQKSINALKKKGYIFKDILKEVMILEPENWDIFVLEAWPEFVNSLPTKNEVKSIVNCGGIFFGPFVGYSNK
jgi:hypothetical protein